MKKPTHLLNKSPETNLPFIASGPRHISDCGQGQGPNVPNCDLYGTLLFLTLSSIKKTTLAKHTL